jgi:ADP-ribose pyrophosphatase YjhB (NUDIX family)
MSGSKTPGDEAREHARPRLLADSDPRWIPLEEWRWTQRHVPITCLDFMPIRTVASRLDAVGLIMRDSPQGPGWSLAGGRIFYNESTEEAAARHLSLNLGPAVRFLAADWHRPDFICQYLTEPREGFPLDTRQHAISLTYLVELEGEISPANEAHEFRWFLPDALPERLSFGQDAFLPRLVAIAHARAAEGRG